MITNLNVGIECDECLAATFYSGRPASGFDIVRAREHAAEAGWACAHTRDGDWFTSEPSARDLCPSCRKRGAA